MVETRIDRNLIQFKGSLPGKGEFVSVPIGYGRFLIGSSSVCEICIQDSSIDPIHAVLERTPAQGMTVYDLNSKTGISSEGNTAPVIHISNELQVGLVNIKVSNTVEAVGQATTVNQEIPKVPEHIDKNKSIDISESNQTPYIIYPFDQNYNFDSSEYIFEPTERLYPIFKYKVDKTAVEVIISFEKRILSVDYIPEKSGTYKLAGIRKLDEHIELSYLGKEQTEDLISFENGGFELFNLRDYELKIFSDSGELDKNSRSFMLKKGDLFVFSKGTIDIYVKFTESPPDVKPAPVFSRDKTVLSYYLLFLFFVSIPMAYFYTREVDKKELDKDKAPERIAKILYNRPEILKSKIKPPKKKMIPVKKPEPKPVEVKKVEQKPTRVKSAGPKIKKDPPKKPVAKGTPPKKRSQSKRTGGAKPKKSKVASNNKSNSSSRRKSKTTAASPAPKAKGTVDVFKSNKFESSINNLMAKGGSFKSITTKGSGASGGPSAGVAGSSGSAGVTTSTISDKIGSPSGIKNGVQDFKAGAGDLVGAKTFYTAGIPSKTVIVGSMDPDIIRKILRENIPQFRRCYQKELDRSAQSFQGVVPLAFVIGASGNVTRAGVQGNSSIPGSVKRCVVNVLRGLQFPKPRGGGRVEVRQPINFYPKN